MTPTEELLHLMREHKLKARHVARILDRSVATVNIWRCKGPTAARHTIPDHALRLLRAYIAAPPKSSGAFDDLSADQRRAILIAQGGEVMG